MVFYEKKKRSPMVEVKRKVVNIIGGYYIIIIKHNF